MLEILQGIKEVVVTLAAAAGAGIAFVGLRTWRKQMIGKEEYELARRFLRSVFETRDAIYTVRHPFISLGETAAALKEKGMEEKEGGEKISSRGRDAAVYESRWKLIQSAMSNLKVETLEAEVLWGNEVRDILKPLQSCVSKLNNSLSSYLSRDLPQKPEEMEKLDDIIYGVRKESPSAGFSKDIDEAVNKIEAYIRPRLKP